MDDDLRKPMTVEEVEELLRATLHGPLPHNTVQRMMATLAEWKEQITPLEAPHPCDHYADKFKDVEWCVCCGAVREDFDDDGVWRVPHKHTVYELLRESVERSARRAQHIMDLAGQIKNEVGVK